MSKVNANFANHVTSVAFHLTLSRQMICALVNVADRNYGSRGQYVALNMTDRAVPSLKALQERGLVSWTDPKKMKPQWKDYPYRLTEAGEHVLSLLEIAGLCSVIRDARDEAA